MILTKPSRQPFAWGFLSALLLVSMLLAACTTASPTASQPGASQGSEAAQEPVTLRLALLPIVDALPFYVAEKQGYFKENGVSIEFIPTSSAAERDQLIAAGQADGMINDLVSVALYNRDGVQVQTVRFARTADQNTALYRVLAAKDSGITSAEGLAGVPIGVSQATIIDYVTSRLLEKEGLTTDQIQTMAVPKLPDRMALLGSGDLKAATLPEPFGSMAEQSGAVVIVDDSKHPEYGNSVISFRKAVIDEHPEAIRGFLAAVEKATGDINQDPNGWRALLSEYNLAPAAVVDSYPLTAFPTAAVPSEAQFADVVAWAKSKGLIEHDLSYGDSVTGQYLP